MKSANLIGLLFIVVAFIFAEAQVYYVDIIDIPINSPQKTLQQKNTQREIVQNQLNRKSHPVIQSASKQVRTVQQTVEQPQQIVPQRQKQARQIRQPQVEQPQQQKPHRKQQVQSQQQPERHLTQQRQNPNTQQQRNPHQQTQKQQQPQRNQQSQQQSKRKKPQQPQRQQTQQQAQGQKQPQQPQRQQQQQQQAQGQKQPQQPQRQQQQQQQAQGQKLPQQPQRQQQQQQAQGQKQPQQPQGQQQQQQQAQGQKQPQQPQRQQQQQQQAQGQQQPLQPKRRHAQQSHNSGTITFPGNTNKPPPLSSQNAVARPSRPFLAAATSQVQPSFNAEESVVPAVGGDAVTATSSSSLNGFNEQAQVFAEGTATSLTNDANFDRNGVNGFNNFDQFNNGFNGYHRGPYDGNNGNYRWFGARRPHANHYRDFANIFNDIDQKAESDYDTSAEDDEMNDDFNGRSVVTPGQYPHMTALGYRASTGETEFKCGGSLISEMFVLTAAHCCFLNGQAPHLVKIGDIKLKEFEGYLRPQRRGVARVVKHPYYNESLFYNDIGLLELTNPIEYTYFVRPIRLWARHEIPYNKLFTMGYGSTSFAQAPTNVLTELDLSVVPLEMCNRTIPADENSPHGIAESQICAKDFEQNRDTCQGDSGGPLQLNLERPRRRRLRYYLVGIISYGTFCRSQQPGVYTRVSSYIDWIASEVWPNYFNNFK